MHIVVRPGPGASGSSAAASDLDTDSCRECLPSAGPSLCDHDGIIAAFEAHEAAVKASSPAERLLVHSAKEGWAPLCAFLDVPVPDEPYPRTNTKEEFFEHMKKADDL